MTTINLISIDATVQRLCEEVARQRPAASPLSLRLFDDIPEPPEGGVWIYDVSGPDEARAIARMQGRDHILLVDHSTLKRQKAALAGSTSEVLLKPVSRKRLEAAVDRLILGMAQPDTALEGLVQYLIQQSLDYQEAERDKGYFIARAVHELRGPLTSLAGYCDLVLERRLGPLSSQQEGVMSRMRRSLSRLSAIVAVMEQLTNHHSGSEPLPQPSEVSYTECIERALHEVAPIIAQR